MSSSNVFRYLPAECPAVALHGRTVAQSPLPLFWHGSGVEFVTDASQLSFEVESAFSVFEPWLRIEVDGIRAIRLPLSGGCQRIPVYYGLEQAPGQRHHVRLFKDTQPMTADADCFVTLRAIVCNGALYPAEKRTRRLEFIGDSITSGEGLAGACGTRLWGPLVFTTAGNYAVETAKRLNADFRLFSQSGWGVYCSWDNNPRHAMPLYYDAVCGVLADGCNAALGAAQPNDFAAWPPDAVVVNLGTNDAAAFENPAWTDPATGERFRQICDSDGAPTPESIQRFTDAMFAFLVALRRRNPNAQLVWAYGLLGQPLLAQIKSTLARYRQATGDTLVHFVALPEAQPCQCGANAHPGPAAHAAAAQTLSNALAELLGWEG